MVKKTHSHSKNNSAIKDSKEAEQQALQKAKQLAIEKYGDTVPPYSDDWEKGYYSGEKRGFEAGYMFQWKTVSDKLDAKLLHDILYRQLHVETRALNISEDKTREMINLAVEVVQQHLK